MSGLFCSTTDSTDNTDKKNDSRRIERQNHRRCDGSAEQVNLIPDLIVDDAVIVDPKVVSCFTETHVAQMVGYLNITGLDLALVINFKNARLDWKRVLRPQATGEHDMPDLRR